MVLVLLVFPAKLRDNYHTSLPLLWRSSGEVEEGTEFATGRCKGAPVLPMGQRKSHFTILNLSLFT